MKERLEKIFAGFLLLLSFVLILFGFAFAVAVTMALTHAETFPTQFSHYVVLLGYWIGVGFLLRVLWQKKC